MKEQTDRRGIRREGNKENQGSRTALSPFPSVPLQANEAATRILKVFQALAQPRFGNPRPQKHLFF
jgi:hypothetical protein